MFTFCSLVRMNVLENDIHSPNIFEGKDMVSPSINQPDMFQLLSQIIVPLQAAVINILLNVSFDVICSPTNCIQLYICSPEKLLNFDCVTD